MRGSAGRTNCTRFPDPWRPPRKMSPSVVIPSPLERRVPYVIGARLRGNIARSDAARSRSFQDGRRECSHDSLSLREAKRRGNHQLRVIIAGFWPISLPTSRMFLPSPVSTRATSSIHNRRATPLRRLIATSSDSAQRQFRPTTTPRKSRSPRSPRLLRTA